MIAIVKEPPRLFFHTALLLHGQHNHRGRHQHQGYGQAALQAEIASVDQFPSCHHVGGEYGAVGLHAADTNAIYIALGQIPYGVQRSHPPQILPRLMK